MVGKKAVFILVLFSLGLAAAAFLPAQTVRSATIDFSGLAEGAIVSSLSNGRGISGDPIEGSISVFGFNPDTRGNLPPNTPPNTNTAMIFDATCAGGCTGGDFDLEFPELGNGLIISEDLDSSDPDDADEENAFFRFDFSNFGPGKVNVKSLIVADVDEATGEIILSRDGIPMDPIPFAPTGDHMYEVVQLNIQNIDLMVVDLNGSGMIDNIDIEIVEQEPQPNITLQGTCEPQGVFSQNLRLTGSLRLDGSPVPNHAVTLNLPNGNDVSVNTDQAGNYSYLFDLARNYIGQNITARATVNGQDTSAQHTITETDFAGCSNGVVITLQVLCEPQGQLSNDLRLSGKLTRDGNPIPNYPITLSLPGGSEVLLNTDQGGVFSYLFEDSRRFIDQVVNAVATVDGNDYSAQHQISISDFTGCPPPPAGPELTIQGICEKRAGESESHDLRVTGKLTDSEELPVPNHLITLELPNGNSISLTTDHAGNYSYLFVGADQYLGKSVTTVTTLDGELLFPEEDHIITAADFEGCQQTKSYVCHNVFLYTSFGQPIELGSQIPGWGIEDIHVVCKGIGQGKSCRLKVKDQPGYLVKSNTLEMDVPRLLPYVKYQAQIKGYDGAWTNKGCEFSFITGGHVASTATHLSDQVDQLGWISLGEGQSAIKPLGVCTGWSDACLFAENIIGLHLDDIYGNQLPGSKLSLLQPGDRISIYRDHRLYTYEFTGSERVPQSADGNQAILEAAEQHDLVLTTCSGYRLIDEGHFSHTRLATFTLLPRVEPLYRGQ
ncbi:MAG: hypothetical protein ACWGOY_11230 [Anaerolineales bacterium]